MPANEEERPWEELEKLVEEPDAERVEAFLDALPDGDAALAVSRLSEDDQTLLLTTLDPEEAGFQGTEPEFNELIESLKRHCFAKRVDVTQVTPAVILQAGR